VPILINPYAFGSGPPLAGVTPTGAWSFGRAIVPGYASSFYTENTAKIDSLKDQSGNARNLDQTTAARRPVIGTGGPNSRACGVFNSTDNTYLTTSGSDPLSDFITNSAGYAIVSFIGTTIDTNQANVWQNEGLLADTQGFMGLFLKTGDAIHCYNWDTASRSNSTAVTETTTYVAEWRHDGGTVYCRLNGSTEVSAVSGNTGGMTGLLRIGNGQPGGSGAALDGKIFELATFSTVPSLAERDAMVASFKAWVGI
jgi:hypothetical protein